MNQNISVDKIKLNRWLNVRKLSFDKLNKLLGKSGVNKITLANCHKTNSETVKKLASILDIPPSKLKEESRVPNYLYCSKKDIEKSKRAIKKDGIHFYNYYTLPSPKGYVMPVILDILCPKNKLPKLNNGHLEPSITISLGPNNINARFAEKLNNDSWIKFTVNNDKKTNWIVGSSYFEPSYCLHTYSRATKKPGRILSYTTKSNLESLLTDKLNDASYINFKKSFLNKNINRVMLEEEINIKGYSIFEISKKTKIDKTKLVNYFKGNKSLTKNNIDRICNLLNIDSTYYYDKKFNEDTVGKSYFDFKKSINSIRKFKSYKIASMASSKRFPDLSGYFIKVYKKNNTKINFDLVDNKCSHYYVTSGSMEINIQDNNKITKQKLLEGDSIWISAYTPHQFTGKGSLIKISDGQNFNYLDKIDLINTYNLKNVLNKTRNELTNWGHEN